jgi:hypothetical protein
MERSSRREEKERPLSAYDQRKKMFEAMDEEEREIIDRHLGKWGDRRTTLAKEEKRKERGRRDEKRNKFEKRGDWGFARLEDTDDDEERPSRGDRRSEDRPRRSPFPGKKGGKK